MKRKREIINYNYGNIDKPIDPYLSYKIFLEDHNFELEEWKDYLEANKRSIMCLPDELLYMIYDRLNATWKSILRLVNRRLYYLYWRYPQLSIKKYIIYQKNWDVFEPPDFYDIKKIKIHTNNIYQFKKSKKKRKYEEINFYENQYQEQERWINFSFEDKYKHRKLIRTQYGYSCNNIKHANSKIDAWLVTKKSMFYKDKNNCYTCKKFDYCIKSYLCNSCLKQKKWKCIHYLFKTNIIYNCKSCYYK
jgi:hypothetical protein